MVRNRCELPKALLSELFWGKRKKTTKKKKTKTKTKRKNIKIKKEANQKNLDSILQLFNNFYSIFPIDSKNRIGDRSVRFLNHQSNGLH